jgi:ribonucleoside-diphosphate reductase alpha chain
MLSRLQVVPATGIRLRLVTKTTTEEGGMAHSKGSSGSRGIEEAAGALAAFGERPQREGQWSESAIRVLKERYLKRDATGVKETPEEMCWRVASAIAKAEERWGKSPSEARDIAESFYDVMVEGQFVPNSPTMMNAGKDNGLQYSACFVLPVEDSMDGIFEAVKRAAIIHKCLVGDTLVMTDKGLTRLSDVPVGTAIMTDEGPFHTSECHDNGEQPVFEVRTHRGFRILGTAEHKLLTVGDDGHYEWRRIGDLRDRDWLIMKPGFWMGGETRLPEFKFAKKPGRNATSFKAEEYQLPRELTPELAELIGLYIGDGSNHRDGIRFTVGSDAPEVIQRITDLSFRLFGKNPSISAYRTERAVEVAILSTQIRQWFEFLGITKASSREAHVPEIILRSPEAVAAAFVRGLFTADGCVRENGHITLTTASERLGEELQIVMLALGIPTQLRPDVSEAGYRSYQLSICTKAGFLAFREKVGFLNRKKQERLAAVDDAAIFVKGETIPNQRQRLRAWYDALPQGERHHARALFDDILNKVKEPRELSRQRMTAVLEREGTVIPPFFEELADQDLFFVRVTDIGYVGIRHVYDLTVPVKHAYLANGLVSRNSGGGTGFAFSRLRPKDTLVKSTGGKASGPVSFLRVFNGATEAVKQGGTRRGANMGILRVDHPDILEFIDSKLDGGITNFNISVAATEKFMDALAKDEDYELIDPHTQQVTGHLRARDVFSRIVQAAWRTGDPGMVFIDRINASPANPVPLDEVIEATNPCGEQPLGPNDACNLGSINLAKFYLSAIPANAKAAERIDWVGLERVVRTSVRFLDDVIEVNPYPLQDIIDEVRNNRRIGLGVMGWADLLLELGIPYDSDEALRLGEEIMGFIQRIGHDASEKLAVERGPFPRWSRSIYTDGKPLRNSTVTTIAPTGTISIIANCSSGIEPIFAVAFSHIVGDRHLTFVNPIFEEVAKRRGFYSEKLMQRVAEKGVVRGIEGVPEDVQRVFVTAHEIDPAWHVKMQAAFQKQTDNGVSKTINMPNSATPDDIAKAYLMAYDLGCLGITVFRDGCKDTQVLHLGTGGKAERKEAKEESIVTPPILSLEESLRVKPRPRTVKGVTYRAETPLGTAFITVNQNGEGEPFEVFANVGKAGSDTAAVSEAIGRLVSLVLRLPSPMSPRERVEQIVNQLSGIGGRRPMGIGKDRVRSLPDAIAQVLSEHIGLSEPGVHELLAARGKTTLKAGDMCPDCGLATLVYEEGCQKCYSCGFSEC